MYRFDDLDKPIIDTTIDYGCPISQLDLEDDALSPNMMSTLHISTGEP